MRKSTRAPGARTRIREFFERNVGRVVTSSEIQRVAGISEWARRVRELRDEEGLQILSHNDREALKPNEYLLETLKPRPVVARRIGDKLRRQILERNGYTCQVCGAGAGEESGCAVGKSCRLEIDHVVPISQGGTDDESNLRAVCVWYNRDKANLKAPQQREAVSILTLVRRQPRAVQVEVYKFLARKFAKEKAGS